MLTQDITMYQADRLKELILQKAVKFGNFQLASGKTAKFYLDLRRVTLDGETANVIAHGVLGVLERIGIPDLVGGMAIGADPITASTITVAWQCGIPLRGFIVRKEAKTHGMGQMVEGPFEHDDRAVILEDVVTTGGSSLKAIEAARAAGLRIDHCICIVDRQQGGEEAMAKIGVKLHSLFKLDELGIDQE
ncbi:MAG: orotate phosphoribosyltransferase [Planctomycetota bacterium]|jgi:orotate phosphoribosyltransferase|nr:orotate phosphoribosyltransferase [Blastopirellula sp.]